MPFLLAKPRAEKYAIGTEITIAHGQATTNILSPKIAQVDQLLVIAPPLTPTKIETTKTIGVYHLANLETNSSALLFLDPLLEMSSKILATAESLYSLITLRVKVPLFTR